VAPTEHAYETIVMIYPRRCPLCAIAYAAADLRSTAAATDHLTMRAAPGGTPSPWRPELSGRLLTLRCGACAGLFEWDYFGSCAVD
jgi:hypothetical protein